MEAEIKFPVKVFTYLSNGKSSSDYYDMTESEIEKKCCIYGCSMYFKNSLPDDELRAADLNYVLLEDIYNYECVAWWVWPLEQKIRLYESLPNRMKEGFPRDHLASIAENKII